MSVIFLLIPLSVLLATGFLGAFVWAVRSGQYDDTCTPSMRLLVQDNEPKRDVARESKHPREQTKSKP
ncbi:MAG: cbb3-type cytochrome oxidase assembly protein CcoS [Verrucomicrobiota bacterium]